MFLACRKKSISGDVFLYIFVFTAFLLFLKLAHATPLNCLKHSTAVKTTPCICTVIGYKQYKVKELVLCMFFIHFGVCVTWFQIRYQNPTIFQWLIHNRGRSGTFYSLHIFSCEKKTKWVINRMIWAGLDPAIFTSSLRYFFPQSTLTLIP